MKNDKKNIDNTKYAVYSEYQDQFVTGPVSLEEFKTKIISGDFEIGMKEEFNLVVYKLTPTSMKIRFLPAIINET